MRFKMSGSVSIALCTSMLSLIRPSLPAWRLRPAAIRERCVTCISIRPHTVYVPRYIKPTRHRMTHDDTYYHTHTYAHTHICTHVITSPPPHHRHRHHRHHRHTHHQQLWIPSSPLRLSSSLPISLSLSLSPPPTHPHRLPTCSEAARFFFTASLNCRSCN